jgi:hypothetical protein
MIRARGESLVFQMAECFNESFADQKALTADQ